jgi:hypothetical protein
MRLGRTATGLAELRDFARWQNALQSPFNHKPTSTNVAVLELGEPEQLIEIQMFAVVD